MLNSYSIQLEKTDKTQYIIGFLCLVVYAGALFFPLMDKDAAHHANIALHMLETNDYASLVDRGTDYLDKPHFLFWSSVLSFKLFGVNTFAHRFPAILFALLTIYSTYRLAKHLSDKTTAKIAALIIATAQGFILSINDARMETPLSAGIILGLSNLIIYIDKRQWLHLFLAALGAAMAFSTKGWIGIVIIFIAAFFYLLLNNKWDVLKSAKTWIFIPLFGLFISPVLYAYYLQFDLHPEKVIRNMTNISGVKFILWDQNFERFGGDNFIKGGRNSSVFFLYHTFLWAFFPWCVAAYVGLIYWFKRMFVNREWSNPFNFAVLAFSLILFTISFSKFKMPHYIFMLMPLAALFTAPFLRKILMEKTAFRFFYTLHFVFAVLVVLATIIINYYFFPPTNILVQVLGPLLLLALIVLLFKPNEKKGLKFFYITAGFCLLFNFFLNYNFFPGLMKYQGGNQLVKKINKEGIQVNENDIVLIEENAHSFDFYRGHNHPIIPIDSFKLKYEQVKDKYFLLTSPLVNRLVSEGYKVDTLVSEIDYNVARMKLKFMRPETRPALLDTIMLGRIIERK